MKNFSQSEQPWNSVRTSFGCWSICLREVLACGNNLPKFKVFAVPFRFRAEPAERIKPQGGGWDKISDFAGIKDEQVKFKIFAIPWFSLKFLAFLLSGEGTALTLPQNLAIDVCQIGSSPRAPADLSRREFPEGKVVIWRDFAANISSTGFIWIKKGDRENFKLQRTAVKYSANTIWLLLYLFVESPCLRADPYKIAENFGAFRLRTNWLIIFC